MTNHHEGPAPLPALVWAVVFTILLVQRWPYSCLSLFASGNHNRPGQALARHPNSCVGEPGRATSYFSICRADRRSHFRGQTGKQPLILSLTAFEPKRFAYRP